MGTLQAVSCLLPILVGKVSGNVAKTQSTHAMLTMAEEVLPLQKTGALFLNFWLIWESALLT